MTKEPRVVVRLIALWVIFVVSLGLIFWAGQQFAVSLVKIASGNYGEQGCTMGYCPPAMTYTSCIFPPPYPITASPMMGESEVAPIENGEMDKYNQDYRKYNESYQEACKQDVVRYQGSQKSSSITDIAGYSVLLLLAVILAGTSLMTIKKAEMEV